MIYSEIDWQYESERARGLVLEWPSGRKESLGSQLPCPCCDKIGFYAPRYMEVNGEIVRGYRACKWCGFWQEAWGDIQKQMGSEPYRCEMVVCRECGSYGWRLPVKFTPKFCDRCNGRMIKTPWPPENAAHPFHRLQPIANEKETTVLYNVPFRIQQYRCQCGSAVRGVQEGLKHIHSKPHAEVIPS